jgi:hypothetical protein
VPRHGGTVGRGLSCALRTLRVVPPVAGFVRCYVAACAGCAIADRIGPDLGIVMIVDQPDPENENDEG